MEEQKWRLWDDLIPDDNLLDGVTFDDLILAVHCNCRVITPEAVRRQWREILEARLEDAKFLLERNMAAIMAEAGKEREE